MEKSTSKPNKEHDAQIAAQARKDAEKEFKQIAEKVNCENIPFPTHSIYISENLIIN